MAACLGPEGGTLRSAAVGMGRTGSIEILWVVHCIAVGVLVVRVSARSWM